MMLNKLKKEEKMLNQKSNRIESTISKKEAQSGISWRLISKFLQCLSPFRVLLGMGCLALSFLIVGSIAITNVDRFMNSECGLSCGYVIEKYTLFNPLDYILVEMSIYFPLDSLFFGLILLYTFITILYGLIRVGIKFLCFTVSP